MSKRSRARRFRRKKRAFMARRVRPLVRRIHGDFAVLDALLFRFNIAARGLPR